MLIFKLSWLQFRQPRAEWRNQSLQLTLKFPSENAAREMRAYDMVKLSFSLPNDSLILISCLIGQVSAPQACR